MHSHGDHDFTGERMIPKHNKGFTFYYEHLLRYLFSAQFVKNKKVLDLGSGSGYGTRMLKALGAKKVLGIDLSEEAVNYSKKTYQVLGVKYVVGDVEKLPDLKEEFDTITAYEIFEHLADHNAFLTGVKSLISKKGIFTVSTPNKLTYFNTNNPYHINELYEDEFKEVLRKHFKYVYLFNQQCLFTHSMVPLNEKSDLKLNFIQEEYITSTRTAFTPEIGNKNSMYFIAVCSDQEIKNINPYSLDTFSVDEFSLEKGVEAMSAAFRNKQNVSPEIKELKRSYKEITSSKFFKLWQSFNRLKRTIKSS